MTQGFVLDVLVQNLWEFCSERLLLLNCNTYSFVSWCYPYLHFADRCQNSRTQNTEHLRMSNKLSISLFYNKFPTFLVAYL